MLGWDIRRKDDAEILKRVGALMKLFVKPRSRIAALMDEQLAIMNS